MKRIFSLLIILGLGLILVGCKPKPGKPLTLNTDQTDKLELTVPFEGKVFPKDGIGEVTLARTIDGDTIHVFNGVDRLAYQIRFHAIDTPESTGQVQPWGNAASKFTSEKVLNAERLVIEGGEIESNGRYLGWVWYLPKGETKFRNLNLELIEQAYTAYTGSAQENKYHEECEAAYGHARLTKLRVYGEKDPDFNYQSTAIATTIHDIVNNQDKYQSGTVFELRVRLVRTCGSNAYLQDIDDVYELDGQEIKGRGSSYIYAARKINFYKDFQIGDEFTIKAKFENANFGPQFTDISDISNAQNNNTPVIEEIDSAALDIANLKTREGEVVKVTNLTITNIQTKTSSSGYDYILMNTKTSGGVDLDVYLGHQKEMMLNYTASQLPAVGTTVNLIGAVALWDYATNGVQLKLGDAPALETDIRTSDIEIVK